MAQPRITSTLTFDEKLFEEYFAGKDRPLNRRDALIFSIGDGLLFGIWFWAGILFNFNFNLMGWIFGRVVGLALVLGIAEALTGATIFWPRRLWRKTYTRFFVRHGVDSDAPRPWTCTLRSHAGPNQVEMSYLTKDGSFEVLNQSYKKFDRILVTKHLIVLITHFDLGSPFDFWHRDTYANALADREATEDAIFLRGSITGMDNKPLSDEDFIAYVGRKISRH